MAKETAIDTLTNAMNRLSALLIIGKVSLIDKIKNPYRSTARIPAPASREYCNVPSTSFTDTLGWKKYIGINMILKKSNKKLH